MKFRNLFVASALLWPVCNLAAAPMEFGGELRLRPEMRANPDFDKDTHKSQRFVGSRLRISGQARAADDVSVKVTFQDTRNWGEEAGTSSGLTDSGEAIDIHEGFVEFQKFAGSVFNLRAGRQELVYGDQRLIGNFGWSNQGRAFDAFKAFLENPVLSIDLFIAKRKENNGTTAANSNQDRDLSGIYSSWKKLLPKTTTDIYFFHDREGDTSGAAKTKNVYTLGARVAGKNARVDYTIETPFQFGDNGTLVGVSSESVKINAYAAAAKAGYTFVGSKEIRVGLGYDFASGDDNASDDQAKTFNNLYPTNHAFYGLMDNQGWRNLNSWNIALSGKPAPSIFSSISFWNFRLAQEKDGWYNAAGTASGSLRSASAANRKKDVGRELNLLLRFTQSPTIIWEAGYGHFFTGQFINQQVQNESDSDWAYLMSTVKF